jgi:hypothetical protein
MKHRDKADDPGAGPRVSEGRTLGHPARLEGGPAGLIQSPSGCTEGAVPNTVMIDATDLKAHRRATFASPAGSHAAIHQAPQAPSPAPEPHRGHVLPTDELAAGGLTLQQMPEGLSLGRRPHRRRHVPDMKRKRVLWP